jgi:myo-inositol-1(or 4)-monophosphatase
MMTGLDRQVMPWLQPFDLFTAIAARAQRTRVMGSAALDLCYVARGLADGYFEAGIYIWDIAAAGLIVLQAGGMVELVASLSENRLCFLATNGRLHNEMGKVIRPFLTPGNGNGHKGR